MTSTNSIYRDLRSATTPVIAILPYNWYSMEDFNSKLKVEGNKTIDGGANVGFELSPWCVDIPRLNSPVKVPVFGIEYLGANSKTTHTDAMGSATVDWSLPVIGGYITADIPISDETTWFYLRPISIGIYNLGALLNARLTVTHFLFSWQQAIDGLSLQMWI